MIAEGKAKRAKEMEMYEAKKQNEETDEEKKARIQRGLQAMNLAPKSDNATDQQAKRKNFYHDIRNQMRNNE